MGKEAPELDEFVIATVKKIFPYGAFCTLDEYGNKEAFIHVSEVASRWVRNIREFVSENQKVVARVHRLIPEKGQIDLSLRRVTDQDRRRKLEINKREKKAAKLLEIAAKKAGESTLTPREVGEMLAAKWGDVYGALEEISADEKALASVAIPEKWKKALLEIAKQNIVKPRVRVRGVLSITTHAPDGVATIREALQQAKKHAAEGIDVSLSYVSAPKYAVSVVAPERKAAEKTLEAIEGDVIEFVRKKKGRASFERVAE